MRMEAPPSLQSCKEVGWYSKILSKLNDSKVRSNGEVPQIPINLGYVSPSFLAMAISLMILLHPTTDPKVKGVELYISNFDRPITEKLSGNLFNDPAYASVACAKVGKVAIADNIAKGLGGEEVFEESRSLLFKTLRVQRIYDTDTNTVVYVSYNTRFDKNDDSNKSRFKSSLCAVNLND